MEPMALGKASGSVAPPGDGPCQARQCISWGIIPQMASEQRAGQALMADEKGRLLAGGSVGAGAMGQGRLVLRRKLAVGFISRLSTAANLGSRGRRFFGSPFLSSPSPSESQDRVGESQREGELAYWERRMPEADMADTAGEVWWL